MAAASVNIETSLRDFAGGSPDRSISVTHERNPLIEYVTSNSTGSINILQIGRLRGIEKVSRTRAKSSAKLVLFRRVSPGQSAEKKRETCVKMTLLPLSDEHFDGDPPSVEENAHDQKVAHLVFSFHKVAVPGVSTAWELSHALLALDHAKKSTRLSSQDRDRLLAAIFAAHSAAVSRLRSIDPGRINLGMRAAAGLVIHWSENAEDRAARHPDVWLDMHTCARVLRNECHNLSILEDMAERRRERQAAIVDDLRRTTAAAVS